MPLPQQTAACAVASPRLRPASEAYGGVRPVRVEQRLRHTLATPNRRPSTCMQPRMSSPSCPPHAPLHHAQLT